MDVRDFCHVIDLPECSRKQNIRIIDKKIQPGRTDNRFPHMKFPRKRRVAFSCPETLANAYDAFASENAGYELAEVTKSTILKSVQAFFMSAYGNGLTEWSLLSLCFDRQLPFCGVPYRISRFSTREGAAVFRWLLFRDFYSPWGQQLS